MTDTGIDQCNCFAVKKAARRIARLYDDHLQPVGLRITQFLILAALREMRSTSVNGLAERLDIERTAMGKMVTLLERDGVVRVRPSPTDGRSRIVELTPEGAELHGRAAPLWLAAQRRFTEANGADEVALLRRSLSAMRTGEGPA